MKLPSSVLAVISALAFLLPIAVITPEELTDTKSLLLLVHIIFLLDALFGVIVATKFFVSPYCSVVEFVSNFIPVTFIPLTLTVIFAIKFPSTVFAVISAFPSLLPTALILPLLSTVTNDVLLLVHIMFLFVALDGLIVAISVSEFP